MMACCICTFVYLNSFLCQLGTCFYFFNRDILMTLFFVMDPYDTFFVSLQVIFSQGSILLLLLLHLILLSKWVIAFPLCIDSNLWCEKTKLVVHNYY